MTVSYTGDVANGSSFGCFWKILIRWRGSVYKLIWRELIAYLVLYYALNLVYRFGLEPDQKVLFEKLKVYCRMQIESIPMSFVLGFYVTLIVKRWWDQYWLLPLPDSLALYVNAGLHGQDERSRLLRRTIMRYTMLAYIITLQRISFRVKKRFPRLEHLVDAGFMSENEKKVFDTLDAKTPINKFWIPIVWASNLIYRARQEGRIQSDHMLQTIIVELSDFRRRLGRVMVYDTVSVPLVYTQVVTLAVYTYFTAALIGKQWVNPDKEDTRHNIYPGYEIDLYVPIFLSLQFIFYVGWLKVAETLINPFGEDDDDFELNWLIDRHFQVSYMVVDEIHKEHPELLKDTYWEEVVPTDLPYNEASVHYRRSEPQGSTASMKIKERETIYDNLTRVSVKHNNSLSPDDVYGEYAIVDSPANVQRKHIMQRMQSGRSSTGNSGIFNRAKNVSERWWNRRSSKGKNRPFLNGDRFPNRPSNLPPVNRPRVPTPDVTKDALAEQRLANKFFPSSNKPLPSLNVNSYAFTPLNNNNNSIDNQLRSFTTWTSSDTFNTSSIPTIQLSPMPPHNNRLQEELPHHKSPPPYEPGGVDQTQQQTTLTTIEENDGSPHSTCSTTRSLKTATYPTASAVFSPIIASLAEESPHQPAFSIPPLPIENDRRKSSVDDEQPYMTIAEVDESSKNSHQSLLIDNSGGGMMTGYERLTSPMMPNFPTTSSSSVHSSGGHSASQSMTEVDLKSDSPASLAENTLDKATEDVSSPPHVPISTPVAVAAGAPRGAASSRDASNHKTAAATPENGTSTEVAKDCEVFV